MKYSAHLFLASALLVGGWFAAPKASAQEGGARTSEGFARNSIFLELLGNGIAYSLNYDHKIFNHLSARIGGMYAPWNDQNSDQNLTFVVVPVMANYLLGNGSSRLEVGAGVSYSYASGNLNRIDDFTGGSVTAFTSTLGYRLQPTDGGFLFRIGFTPTFFKQGMLPLVGLSLGGTF